MAFVATAVGGLLGGGLIGNIAVAAIGIGINLAIAYFFPQKIKGPRAESLKAQTSKYGDHIARIYGTDRTAGAVIWLKDDKVDEHVTTERQGKALGPEVTSYTYTATFAVALAWNGPFTAVPRIWADDKLIYDNSAESLQALIDTGGTGIGVAEGATVTIYLGTDTQGPDPDIEADRGAGNVPAYPKLCYVVIKDLPLDEFGIRVPNIEAEIVRTGEEATVGYSVTDMSANPVHADINNYYLVNSSGVGGIISIRILPSEDIRTVTVPGNTEGIHITPRGEIVLPELFGSDIWIVDGATATLTQTLTGVLLPNGGQSMMDSISISGATYLMLWRAFGSGLSLFRSTGSGYSLLWQHATAFEPLTGGALSLSLGPDYAYGMVGGTDIYRIAWSSIGLTSATTVTLSEPTDDLKACHYDPASDSVIVLDFDGNLFRYTPDLATLLVSNLATGIGTFSGIADPLLSVRMKSGTDRIAIHSNAGVFEFTISSLTQLYDIDPLTTDWPDSGNAGFVYTGVSERVRAILIMGLAGGGANPVLWFLPRQSRAPEPLADILDAECRSVGLVPDVSRITSLVKGYGERSGSAPRGVIEDLIRVNFVDFAQVDGLITFFPRNTASIRTLAIADTGMAFNAVPDPVQIKEDYPAALDIPEQVIIQYTSWDAIYRLGSQAANPEEDQPFPDEPSEADGSGFPVKVRKKRFMEFATAQVLGDDEAAQVADLMHNELQDAGTVYKTTVGPEQLDLYPGLVISVPLDDTRVAKAVVTKMSGETIIELELRKRGDSYESEAVGQPTPYVIDSLLGIATATPVLIDGHLMRADDDDEAFYAGIAVTSGGQFRSGTLFQSEDGGSTYQPWATFTNGTIRGFAIDALPDRPHPDAFDRTSSFNIAVPNGSPPDSVSEESLLASETSNAFAVWNASVGDWEYIRAASVVDNLDGTWTLSTLLRGRKGTENAMAGHAAGAVVYHLDAQAIARATDADRTLSRIYVAVPSSTRFNSAGAVTFTNTGKGLRPWAPQLASAVRDSGSGDWTFTWNRRDRLGQEWPEDGAEDPPMSEDTEEYTVNFYSGVTLMGTYTSATESYVYSAADQTSDFGSPQTSIEIGIAQVSVIYGDGVELREAA